MALKIKDLTILASWSKLATLPDGKLLINTINAHSFNTAQYDTLFAEALSKGDVLIPDGVSIVWACKWLKVKNRPKVRIAGWDLFEYEMGSLSKLVKIGDKLVRRDNAQDYSEEPTKPKVMFVGSSNKVLAKIVANAAVVYPNLEVLTYSPPFKAEFSDEDNAAIIKAINDADPDLLWIGMTAPKQEKWTYSHWQELNIHCHVGTIGAVFDFFAGTRQRAPKWWQKHSIEWLYRQLKEPKRMWRRYILGNPLFIWSIIKEKFSG